MLQRETDAIDVMFIMLLAPKQGYSPLKTVSSRRHVLVLFRYQCRPRHGKQVTSRKLCAGKTRYAGACTGSLYHLTFTPRFVSRFRLSRCKCQK